MGLNRKDGIRISDNDKACCLVLGLAYFAVAVFRVASGVPDDWGLTPAVTMVGILLCLPALDGWT